MNNTISKKLIQYWRTCVPKKLLWILLLGFILRLIVFVMLQPWTDDGESKVLSKATDSYNYHALALELKNEGTFASSNPYLSAIRTPGYPFFIAFCYSVFGETPWVVILFQIMLDCVLIAIIYMLANCIFSQSVSLIASLLYSIEPLAIQYANTLLSDMLFLFIIVVSYLVLWIFLKSFKNKWMLLYIFSIAVAAYVRPIAVYLFILNLLFIISYLKIHRQNILKIILINTFFYFLLISPWMLRNFKIHDNLFFSTSANYNSLILYAADVEAEARGISYNEVKREYQDYFSKIYPEISNKNIYGLHVQYKKKAVEIIKTYPAAFISSYVRGLSDMFFSPNRQMFELIINQQKKIAYDAVELLRDNGLTALKNIYNDYPKVTLIYILGIMAWYFFSYLFAGIGLVQLFLKKNWLTLFFILIPILYFTLLTGQAGLARFKLPIIPFYLVLTAFGIRQFIANNKFLLVKLKIHNKELVD